MCVASSRWSVIYTYSVFWSLIVVLIRYFVVYCVISSLVITSLLNLSIRFLYEFLFSVQFHPFAGDERNSGLASSQYWSVRGASCQEAVSIRGIVYLYRFILHFAILQVVEVVIFSTKLTWSEHVIFDINQLFCFQDFELKTPVYLGSAWREDLPSQTSFLIDINWNLDDFHWWEFLTVGNNLALV